MIRAAVWRSTASTMLLVATMSSSDAQVDAPSNDLQSPRLYVLDGGILASDPTRYRLTVDEVDQTELAVAAFLVVHPRGVLLWDAGAIADDERDPRGVGVEQRVLRHDGQERFVTLGAPLVEQLRASGFGPEDVTHLALSHYHWDHTANANAFAHATWLVPEVERNAMFAGDPPGGVRQATYAALAESSTEVITDEKHDVFGDGAVVIKRAAGHTEGHAVLYVKLARTGGVVLSGDLYHYAEERALARLPTFEVSEEATRKARADVEQFLARTGAALWIQHDLTAHRKLRKAPEYYE